MTKLYLSKAGSIRLENKLKELKEKLINIREVKNDAYTSTGDSWHDNPFFNQMEQEEQREVTEITKIESQLSSAIIVDEPVRNTDRVAIGSIVTVYRYYKKADTEEEVKLEIVCYGDTDFSKNQIAYDAPIVAPLMGLEIGETCTIKIPGDIIECEVVDLHEG